MRGNFSWCRRQNMAAKLEFLRHVPLLGGKGFEKYPEILPALFTELEEPFNIVIRNGSRIGDWSAREPVDIALFGRKYMPHQIAYGCEAAIAMGPSADLQNFVTVLAQP